MAKYGVPALTLTKSFYDFRKECQVRESWEGLITTRRFVSALRRLIIKPSSDFCSPHISGKFLWGALLRSRQVSLNWSWGHSNMINDDWGSCPFTLLTAAARGGRLIPSIFAMFGKKYPLSSLFMVFRKECQVRESWEWGLWQIQRFVPASDTNKTISDFCSLNLLVC